MMYPNVTAICASEIWKDIPGAEGKYQISNRGEIKSLARWVSIGSSQRFISEKIRKLTPAPNGYLHCPIIDNRGQRRYIRPHRLVALLFVSNPDNLPEVNHEDGNKTNNNDWNLTWVTSLENQHHAVSMGLHDVKGEKHNKAKLKNDQVIKIRELYSTGNYTQKQLAADYSVGRTVIGGIVRNELWRHLL